MIFSLSKDEAALRFREVVYEKKYGRILSVGDLIVKTKGECCIFPHGTADEIGGKYGESGDPIAYIKEYDVAIVISAFKPTNLERRMETNEHVIQIVSAKGIGWT